MTFHLMSTLALTPSLLCLMSLRSYPVSYLLYAYLNRLIWKLFVIFYPKSCSNTSLTIYVPEIRNAFTPLTCISELKVNYETYYLASINLQIIIFKSIALSPEFIICYHTVRLNTSVTESSLLKLNRMNESLPIIEL